MTLERVEELIKRTAYPESNSVYQAMMQLWNEVQQECNSKICRNCQHYKNVDYSFTMCQGDNPDFGCTDFKERIGN